MKRFIAKLLSTRKTPSSFEFSQINSILIKPIGDAIGDAIMHLYHIAQLKLAYPNIKIGIITTQRNRAILERANYANVLIEENLFQFLEQRKKWDLYLDFSPTFTTKSLWLDFILCPQIIVNFGKKYKKHYNLDTIKNYDYAVNIPECVHFKDYLFYSPLSLLLKREEVNVTIPLLALEIKKISTFWDKPKAIKIVLNPQGNTRKLPENELIELLTSIPRSQSIEMILINTDKSEIYFKALHNAGIHQLKLAPKTSIFEYCALIDSADIVIAVDGGGVHISCLYHKPLLAFYANQRQNLQKWHPVSAETENCLTIIAEQPSSNNNDTHGFNMLPAKQWLSNQLKQLQK